MYFITPRSSETGKKFAEILIKKDKAFADQVELSKKYGFEQWRDKYWCAFGGFSACIFKTPPDTKVWKLLKDTKNEWMPRLNRRSGNLIKAEFDKMTRVSDEELNQCIGYDSHFNRIGFAWDTELALFGFTVGDDWNVIIPTDCEEVTFTKYKEIFERPQKCKVCGCTDSDCKVCIEKTGEPCYWIEPDLCSACL